MMEEKRINLVYDRFIVPAGLHYYGITDDLEKRTKIGSYKRTSLQQYIDEYGWESINTTIVADSLTRKEAEQLEDRLIKEGWKRGDCINKQGSGGYERDDSKEYCKQYYKEHKKDRIDYQKQYNQTHKEAVEEYNKKRETKPERKVYNRVKTFNRRHPDKVIETPLEAKQKYLQWGYIPSYISIKCL